jgi:hypothetical protein
VAGTIIMKTKIVAVFVLVILPTIAQAVEYNCTVTKKISSEHEYTAQEISKWQFSVLIEENKTTSYLSRCSFAKSVGKITCDRYEVDKVSTDKNAKIKKYYIFGSHFDVQLFSNLTFIENEGRGSIAFGKCRVTSP